MAYIQIESGAQVLIDGGSHSFVTARTEVERHPIRESHNSGNIDEDEEKPSASVITYPILREAEGKQQNWFYGTNSGSLPSMTLLDLFQRLSKNGDDDINGIDIVWYTSYK